MRVANTVAPLLKSPSISRELDVVASPEAKNVVESTCHNRQVDSVNPAVAEDSVDLARKSRPTSVISMKPLDDQTNLGSLRFAKSTLTLQRSLHDFNVGSVASNHNVTHSLLSSTSFSELKRTIDTDTQGSKRLSIADIVGRSGMSSSCSHPSLSSNSGAPIIRLYPRKSVSKSVVSVSDQALSRPQDSVVSSRVDISTRENIEHGANRTQENGCSDYRDSIGRVDATGPEFSVIQHKKRSSWSVSGSGGLVSGVVLNKSRDSLGFSRHVIGAIQSPSSTQPRDVGDMSPENIPESLSRPSETESSSAHRTNTASSLANSSHSRKSRLSRNASVHLHKSSIDQHNTPPVTSKSGTISVGVLSRRQSSKKAMNGNESTSAIPSESESTKERQDYYSYLENQQRHNHSNFIIKMDSADMVYTAPQHIKVKIVGPYVFGDKIGKGAFGKVKEGLCSETLQRVAIKILSKKRLRKVPRGIQTTLREIRELRKLKHKNVITLIDVYCKVEDDEDNLGIFNWFPEIEEENIMWRYDDGNEVRKKVEVVKWYMVFEYCPCSLQTLIEQSPMGKLSEASAHQYFGHLIDGLEYLHSQSIIHHDIKPGNMLITADGVLKISDFGVAEQFSPYDNSDMLCEEFSGTHQFLSPEVVDGSSSYCGTKVDIYAAGVTLYNMVTGRYPFEFHSEANILGLYDDICQGAFTIPSDIDPDLQSLIQFLLQKNPDQRCTIAQCRAHPWMTRQIETGESLSRVMSYPIVKNSKKDDEDPQIAATANKVRITPCETTMIPYLEKMYADELKDQLARCGAFYQLGSSSTLNNVR